LGSRACTALSTPITLTSNIARQSSGAAVAMGSAPKAPPAFAKRTSTESREAAKASTAARSVTSRGWTEAEAPLEASSLARASRRSARRAVRTTW
jgi:hypothetical protein